MKTTGLFFSPLRREKSRRDGTLLTVCFSLRTFSLQTFSLRAILLPALAFFSCACLHAQVTIGGIENPRAGAILDLNSTNKGGLLLSNVTIADPEFIPYDTDVFPGITGADADVNPALCGAMVYNIGQGTPVPAGIYIWNGCKWTKDGGAGMTVASTSPSLLTLIVGDNTTLSVTATGCPTLSYEWFESLNASTSGGTSTGITTADYTVPNYTMPGTYYYYCAVSSSSNTSKVTSDLFTVTVINIPSAGDPGKGQFIAGETCFDVNAGGNATCGATANRSTMDLSVTYTYTFKHVTANKNLQFLLKDAVGAVELIGFSSGSGDLSAIPAGAPAVTLTAINTALAGKTSFTAESTYNITFKFKNTLNQQGGNPTAYGTTNSNPLEVTLSALYEDNASTLRIENRVISIKDCNCCGNPDSPGTLVYNGITYRTAAYATGTDGSEQCWMITPSEVGTTNLCNVSYTLVGYTSTPSDASVCPAGWRIPTRTEASLLNPDLSSSYWQREGWVIQGTWAGCQSMNYNELRMLTTDTTGYYWRNADLWEWRSRISDENIQVRCIYDY